MENKKKVNIWTIITCILLIICIWQNFALKSQLNDMNNNLKNRISEVRTDVNNITANVNNALEKETSMLSFSDYYIENADLETMTVDLICEVLPKEFSEENTEVAIVYEGTEYPMEFKNGNYQGTIPISFFSDAAIESVIMRDGDVSRTEPLNWYVSPRYDYLPMVYADFGNSSSWRKGDGCVVWDISGIVNYQVDQKGEEASPEEAYFCVKLDDEMIEKLDVSSGSHFSVDEKYEIPYGSTMTLYVEVIDALGLHHQPILECVVATEDGDLTYDEDEWIWRGAVGDIYDENGKLLYSEWR